MMSLPEKVKVRYKNLSSRRDNNVILSLRNGLRMEDFRLQFLEPLLLPLAPGTRCISTGAVFTIQNGESNDGIEEVGRECIEDGIEDACLGEEGIEEKSLPFNGMENRTSVYHGICYSCFYIV